MDDSSEEAIKIISRLREEGGEALIGDLLNKRYNGEIPDHTGAGIFGTAIGRLVDSNFIEVYDSDGNDISKDIKEIGDSSEWRLNSGYKVAYLFRGQEEVISSCLTDKLGEIQSVLGVSISSLIEDIDSDTVRATPIFGEPVGYPTSDIFVIMPFGDDFNPIYYDHIRPVCDGFDLSCKRSDDIFDPNNIIEDIWRLIYNSDLIIADCTNRNPNVFYELGIAHTLGKKVIIITQSSDDIPFDIKYIRHIEYEYTPRGMKEFEGQLKKFLASQRG